MLTPVSGQTLPPLHTKDYVYFDCSCGRKNILKKWVYYISGETKTCGECNKLLASYFVNKKFGKLMLDPIHDVFPGTKRKTQWKCDCGNYASIAIRDVIFGKTKSCGKCNLLLASYFINKKFGKLILKDPINCFPQSSKKLIWRCDCGRETKAKIHYVLAGKTKSCGKCNLILASEFINRKFGKLKLKFPEDLKSGSNKKVLWICDCGNEKGIQAYDVLSGRYKSCGKCNLRSSVFWDTNKFGRLKLKNPTEMFLGSHKNVMWLCDCGRERNAKPNDIVFGGLASCGLCFSSAMEWFEINQNELLKLKGPIDPSEFPSGWLTPLETIKNERVPFRAICKVCSLEYKPSLYNIKRGISLTCGCTNNRISKGHRDIVKFLESINLSIQIEYKIEKSFYDILIPEENLIIEFNGLRWHSLPRYQIKDYKKYLLASKFGFDYVSIFEDEWFRKKDIIKNILKNRFGLNKPLSVRPNKCEMKMISSSQADEFYEFHHYIGACKAKINYGVYYENELVACCSFKRPTRQSKYPWELVRMVSCPNIHVHGIWSKILKLFISEYNPSSIVSFSDNRLFNGQVYSKIGFSKDGELKPDYYWVKGMHRYHKSGLRKNKIERESNLTESELRESEGYKKIWDLGKVRWVWYPKLMA